MDAHVPYNRDECPYEFRFGCTHLQAKHIFTQWADRLARRGCQLEALGNDVQFETVREDTISTDFIYNVPAGHRVFKS